MVFRRVEVLAASPVFGATRHFSNGRLGLQETLEARRLRV
jgi:hypothetical protein